jgi:hypothetical protein
MDREPIRKEDAMTYHDSHRDLGFDADRNRPWYHDDSDMVSGGLVFGVAVAAVLAFGAIMFAVNNPTATTTASSTPPTTTGQGGAPASSPSSRRLIPYPWNRPQPEVPD